MASIWSDQSAWCLLLTVHFAWNGIRSGAVRRSASERKPQSTPTAATIGHPIKMSVISSPESNEPSKPAAQTIQVSSVRFVERYELLDLLGEGIYAKVYRAREKATGLIFAVKALSPHLSQDSISIERFRREIQITRYLNHPQILSIYDLVKDDDRLYLIMEFIPGLTLKDYIGTHSPVPIAQAISILNQLLSVLRICHRKNVIHRDLKPQNVMVLESGQIKVLDFGISRMTSLSDLTQTGTSLGSPEYMAPELFSANIYDLRTDIYALGIMLFEILSGRLPYQGDSLPLLYRLHVSGAVPDLRELRSDIPKWLVQVVERMLEKQPFARYQCIEEIESDVRAKQVMVSQLPKPPRRNCIDCGKSLLLELPVCLYCGQDMNRLFASTDGRKKQGVDVIISPTTDRDRLSAYLERIFGKSASLSIPTPLLVAGLNETAAESLKRSAANQGVYLETRKAPRGFRAGQALSAALYLSCFALLIEPLFLLTSVVSGTVYFFRLPAWNVWVPIAGLVFFPMAIRLYLADRRVGRLTPEMIERETPVYHLLMRFLPALQFRKSPAMADFLAQMIEKFILLQPALGSLESSDRATLGRLIELSAEAATTLTEMESRLNQDEFFQWGQEFSRLEADQNTEGDPRERERARRRLNELHERLEIYFEVEERFSALTACLSQIQFQFSQLTGKILVERAAYSDFDRRQMTEAVSQLEALRDVATTLRNDVGLAA